VDGTSDRHKFSGKGENADGSDEGRLGRVFHQSDRRLTPTVPAVYGPRVKARAHEHRPHVRFFIASFIPNFNVIVDAIVDSWAVQFGE
jgi:hypothetical protein